MDYPETHTDVIQSWAPDDEGQHRFLTLYIAGTPAGASDGRADYWSLSPEQAMRLGQKLLVGAGRALGLEGFAVTAEEAPA
jgi:hypothetical protein